MNNSATDRELLAAYLQGSHEAFRALADRYVGLIYATAKRQAPPHLAEDITQAVFLLLAQRAHTLRNPQLLPAWLLKITRYCAANARRSDQRRHHHEQKAAAMATTISPPPLDTPDLDPHLDAALASLSAPDRTALLLRFYNDHSLAQIAASLSISEEAAKKRVARALEKLRKHFLRRGLPLALPLLATTLAQHSSAAPPALAAKVATAALTKSTAATSATLIAKGALKLMAYTTAKWTAAALLITVTTTAIIHSQKTATPPPPAIATPAAIPTPSSILSTIQSTPSILHVPQDPIPTIEVRDSATNTPLAGVQIKIITGSSSGPPAIDAQPSLGETAAGGTIQLPYPPTDAEDLVISAFKPGYVPVGTRWHRLFPTDIAPDHFSFRLEKPITIGGRVLDIEGNPLPGATIFAEIQKQYEPDINFDSEPPFTTATTDANGNWTLPNVPAQYEKIAIGASHPLCLDGSGLIPFDFAVIPDPAQLRALTYTLRLQRGTLISGTVYGPDGKPHKAAITIGELADSANRVPDILTTDDGHFQFATRKGTQTVLAVHAPGFGSVTTTITPEQPMQMNMTLAIPKPLTAHIADSLGNPIPNATVSIDSWTDPDTHLWARDFPITLISDRSGNITWTEAPDKKIATLVTAPGCLAKRDVILTPGTTNQITLFPYSIIHVHTLDASTGKIIPNARLIVGTADHRYHDNINWLDGSMLYNPIRSLPDGSQLLTFNQQHDSLFVRAADDRYAPTDSAPLPMDGHSYDITLPLPEAERLAGQLLDADQLPLPNTRIFLSTGFLDIYDAALPFTPTDIQRDSAHYALTDKDGNFSFPPQIDPYLLIVSTDKGYVLLHSKEFDINKTLTLTPWSTVEGTLRINNAPARAGIPLNAKTSSYYDNPGCIPQYNTTTDAHGPFTFTHVFAGEYLLKVNPDVNQQSLTTKNFKTHPAQTTILTLETTTP